MPDIHFECPHCAQPMAGNAALVNETVTCPACETSFEPTLSSVQKIVDKLAEEKLESYAQNAAANAATQAARRAAQIHDHAWSFSLLAAIFLVIGLCGLLVRILNGIDSDYGDQSGLLWGATCLGAALWLYLIAQVIHIRANTEK